jgi:hypothetical protein
MMTPAASRLRRAISAAALILAATAGVILGALVIWSS